MAFRPAPQTRVTVEQPAPVICATLDAIAALAFQGITPPLDPTPEDLRAVRSANLQLAQLAEQVRGIQATRETGCG